MSASPPSSPSLPWKTKLACLFTSIVAKAVRRPNGSVNRRLLNFLEARNPPEKPINGVKAVDVTVDPSRNIWYRVYTPTEAPDDVKLPVIINFHGGGFTFSAPDVKNFDLFARRMAALIPAIVFSINYRLAPENRCPAPYDDGVDVIKYLDSSHDIERFAPNADLSRCFVAGDSAGGNIAHHVARRVSETKSQYRAVRLLGVVEVNPFFGGEERTPAEIRLVNAPLLTADHADWYWKAFLPAGSNRDHEAANVSGPRARDISSLDFPPTMVVVAGFDPLQDWQRRYVNWLRKSGKEAHLVEYPNMIHAFYTFPEFPECFQVISEMRDFIHRQLDKISN